MKIVSNQGLQYYRNALASNHGNVNYVRQDVFQSAIAFNASRQPINDLLKYYKEFEEKFDQIISSIADIINRNEPGIVVLDIDGTVLADDYRFYLPKFDPKKVTVAQFNELIRQADETFKKGQSNWDLKATPKSQKLISLLERNNIPYVYVSSRPDMEQTKKISEYNLNKQGLYGKNCCGIYLSPIHVNSRNEYKQQNFQVLKEQYGNVLAMVGNSDWDFILEKGDYGFKFYKDNLPGNFFRLPS